MQKVIKDKTVYFYEEANLIMYIDYSTDELIWYFNTNEVIKITNDMELYSLINNFMNQDYIFNDELLKSYKDKDKLIWYSDCYYNPDDEWSVDSVSSLNIERKDNYFNVWCNKKLYERINKKEKTHCIGFSPLMNGVFSRNINTALTLQDDFSTLIYQPLIKIQPKVLKK